MAHGRRAALLVVLLLAVAAVSGSLAAREREERKQHKNEEEHRPAHNSTRRAHRGGNHSLRRATMTPEQELEFEHALATWNARRIANTGGLRADPGSPYKVNNLVCPADIVHVAPEAGRPDPYSYLGAYIDSYVEPYPSLVANKTFLLAPGEYTFQKYNDTIDGTVFFRYSAMCVIGTGDKPDDVRIVGARDRYQYSRTMFEFDVPGSIGFKNLAAFGGGVGSDWGFASVGYRAGTVGDIYAEGIIAQDFWHYSYGAVFYAQFLGHYKDSIFMNNDAYDDHGGAVDFAGSAPVCQGLIENCIFWGNHAGEEGGAIYVHAGCTLALIDNQYLHNSGSDGGAMYIKGTVNITGKFCAQSNSAFDGDGGFAYVDSSGKLAFTTPEVQTAANNAPDDVYIYTPGIVTSAGYAAPWAMPSGAYEISYYMLATVGQCSANFTSGTSNTCYACSRRDWSPTSCSCRAYINIGLTVAPTTAPIGATLTYSVTMNNTGDIDAPPANGFTLELPACITVPDTLTATPSIAGSPSVSCSATRPLVAGSPTTVTCNAPNNLTLPAGDTWSWVLSPFMANAPCTAVATATLTQPSTGSSVATAAVTVTNTCTGGDCCNTDGTLKSSSTVCRRAPCIQDTYCTGSSPTCPPAVALPDGLACHWVQPNLWSWFQQSAQHTSVGVASSAAGGAAPPSDDIMLAFKAVADGAASTAGYHDEDSSDADAALRPCLGHCVSGKCELVFPFQHPAGGCCRVETYGAGERHGSRHGRQHHRHGRPAGAYYDGDYDNYDNYARGKPTDTKVCWEQVANDRHGADSYERDGDKY